METLEGSPPIRLWRRRLRKRTSDASPRVWVMVPGFGDSPLSWLPLVSLLIARGAPCDELVLIELPGGVGSKHSEIIPTADELMRRLGETVSALAPTVLLGQSMGGYLAAWVAAMVPLPGLQRLVLMCPSGLVLLNRPEGAWMDVLTGLPDGKVDAFLDKAMEGMASKPAFRIPAQWFAAELGNYLRRTDVHDFLRSFREGHEMDGKIGRISVPTLLIWGESDRLVPFFLFEHWKGELQASGLPHAFLTLPGTGHGVHIEQSRSVARAIRRFTDAI